MIIRVDTWRPHTLHECLEHIPIPAIQRKLFELGLHARKRERPEPGKTRNGHGRPAESNKCSTSNRLEV